MAAHMMVREALLLPFVAPALLLGCVGQASGTIRIGQASGTITVRGRVVDLDGRPAAGAKVMVIGHAPVAAGPDGAFAVEEVVPPYDLAAVSPAAPLATVYQGVQRTDPVVALGIWEGTLRSATLRGQVIQGDPVSPSQLRRSRVAFGSRAGSWVAEADPDTGAYALAVDWSDGESMAGELHALQWDTDCNGQPVGYGGHARLPAVAVADGAVLGDRDLVLGPAGTRTLSGAVELPTGWTLAMRALDVVFSQGPSISLVEVWGAGTDFAYATPEVPGAAMRVVAYAEGASGGYVAGQVAGLVPEATGVALKLRPPVELLSPPEGAAGVDPGTAFRWTSFGGLHSVHIRADASSPYYVLVTAGNTTHIPDLSALGLELPPGAAYDWSVFGTTLFRDVDDFAGAPLVGDVDTDYVQAITAERPFTAK